MWNYRIGTKVQKIKIKNSPFENRLFFIFECYYNKNTKLPDGYPERLDELDFPNLLVNETKKELKGTYKLIAAAFDKPIIDLDNWPNEYKK